MRFSEVVLDTSLLASPTARRFFMASWELQGLTVPVLPRVVRELHGVMADSEESHWNRVLAGDANRGIRHDAPTTNRILASVREAVRQWVRDTLDAQQEGDETCALRVVRMQDEKMIKAREIAETIPAGCFKGPSQNFHYGDREIIGQAAVEGYRVLALNNRSSIRRASANRWLREHAGVNDDLLRDPDDAVYQLHANQGVPDTDMLKVVLHACLPDTPRSEAREDQIVTQFLSRLGGAGIEDCVAGMARTWRSEEGRELRAEVRDRFRAGSIARQTEAHRVEVVREAARKSGWRGGR